ncbi:MAG: 1-deoxy-D-xylulose-5-phosphate reductoisomerase [bacterium]|nr:1-deoxy-D-xylulose-5-phosphate reductoisomerase [bacterium]
MPKNIAILGSTGSIGRNTLDVIRSAPGEYNIVALAAGTNAELLAEQAREFAPNVVALRNEKKADEVEGLLGDGGIAVLSGEQGLNEAAKLPDVDLVVAAMVGFAGLRPTLAALNAGKTVALANKETLVAGGALVESYLRDGSIIPIDSEHSALAQCLLGADGSGVKRLILTASGGAFRDYDASDIYDATPEQALKHPNWNMGAKITVDSATLMNKGLEVIEAHWLFDTPYDDLDVMIHPQSVVHSMVEFADGSYIAQMGPSDMRIPIQFALQYPKRVKANYNSERFSLLDVAKLEFYAPDTDKYPALELALAAGREGGTMPTTLNAANEVAVGDFLEGNISFGAIAEIVEDTLAVATNAVANEESIFAADEWARRKTEEISDKYKK